MGQQKTTQTTTIPGASGSEATLMALLSRMAQQFGGQMGDLSQLAKEGFGGPSESDYQLVNQIQGRTNDMAQRDLQRMLGPMLAQLNETSAGRGIGGSSIDSLNRALAGQEIGGRLSDLLAGSQAQGAQALLNLPQQRAEMKLGANAALFQMLTGAANPVIQAQLQARMAQPSTTMKTPMGPGQLAQMGAMLGSLPFGGAPMAAMGGLSAMGGMAGLPNYVSPNFNTIGGPFGPRG